jgi:hypothetical protein
MWHDRPHRQRVNKKSEVKISEGRIEERERVWGFVIVRFLPGKLISFPTFRIVGREGAKLEQIKDSV